MGNFKPTDEPSNAIYYAAYEAIYQDSEPVSTKDREFIAVFVAATKKGRKEEPEVNKPDTNQARKEAGTKGQPVQPAKVEKSKDMMELGDEDVLTNAHDACLEDTDLDWR